MEFVTRGTCSTRIRFSIENDTVRSVEFDNGCSGNLKALAVLVEGMGTEELIRKLKGIECGGKGTSCADQLARAIAEAKKLGPVKTD